MPKVRREQAFDRYWRMGDERSIERLREALLAEGAAPSLRSLYEWSRQEQWQFRILELDRRARDAADEERAREQREMYERQARAGLLLQQRGAQRLSELESEGFSAEAAIRAVVEGAKLERIARGEPGERQELKNAYSPIAANIAALSDDDLAALTERLTPPLG